jgi:signal transduction histidine kinase
MTPADALRATQLFEHLPDDEIAGLIEMCDIVALAAGERLIEEGTAGDAFFVVVDGELEVTKRSGSGEVPLARLGPGGIVGEMAVIEGAARNASVTAVTDGRVLRVPSDALLAVLERPRSAAAVLRTVMRRLRSTEALLREREKLAGLGTLAAGLAHELNNPAAAAARSVDALRRTVEVAESQPHPVPAPKPPAGTPPGSALERSDRVEAVAAIAFDHDAATALVDAGWTAETLAAQPAEAIPWLAADASIHQLLGELAMAVGRISEIVGAVKGYAYLDQAPAQRVDLRVQLDQTLVILRHRLRDGITVERDVADDLPQIEAYGSELNQVWTNLVDNAIDAMDGRGTLTIRAERSGADEVAVTVCDTGSGIGDAIRARLFEPFATTKPPGKGTGLGLHISHTVVARHGGRIDVESAPGHTCFVVTLPVATAA